MGKDSDKSQLDWERNLEMVLGFHGDQLQKAEMEKIEKAAQERAKWRVLIKEDQDLFGKHKILDVAEKVGEIIKKTGGSTFGKNVQTGLHMPKASTEVPDKPFVYIRWDFNYDSTMCREIACGVFREPEILTPVGFKVYSQSDLVLLSSTPDDIGQYLAKSAITIQMQEKRNKPLMKVRE